MKWGVQWLQLLKDFPGFPVIQEGKGKKVLIRSISPLCQLSKGRQGISAAVEKLCISFSLFHFGFCSSGTCSPLQLWLSGAWPRGKGGGRGANWGWSPWVLQWGGAGQPLSRRLLCCLCPPTPTSLSPACPPGGRGSSSHQHRDETVVLCGWKGRKSCSTW